MGALLYELLIGLPPFYSRDPNEIYESVLSEELTFPDDVPLTSECKSLLRGLLCKDSKQRLGSIHGVKEILAHPWFGKNAYKNFLEKKIAPPITFDSVGKIDLDKLDEKQKKEVDDLIKAQKSESHKFKREMKNFYHDYRGLTEEYASRESLNKENREKMMLRSSSSRRFNNGGKYTHLFSALNRKSSQKELNKTLNSFRK
jgi:serine/threonine protein kinase